ncbi:caspase Dronc-like [Onthophagus taurus]|uniref:caspase Dronc-like n=1 Tax=Onthophagus taurus TaxID=166361 RepID=UPI0039BE2DE2
MLSELEEDNACLPIEIEELQVATQIDSDYNRKLENCLPCQSEPENKLKINIKKTGIYFHGLNTKYPTYNTLSPHNRGMLLLITNIDFESGEKTRNGANVDHENVKELFKQLGFYIVEAINRTKSEMEEIVKSFATDPDLKKYDICATIVMSHGSTKAGETMIVTTDGEDISTKWIVEQFYEDKCKGMVGKPKIFIFQCCRSAKSDVQIDTSLVPRKIEDILICYCTVPDYNAYRHTIEGSWYINDLCQVFMEHAHDTDIEHLLKMVDEKLRNRNDKDRWQTSEYENLGFKDCYLNPC